MLKECLENVRRTTPLVHNITNYVTVNDVANIILASGASPIMADEMEEVEEIVSICGGLNINIGTLNCRTIESIMAAGAKANELGRIVVFDPVGAGASNIRTETAKRIMNELKIDVIKGNASEMRTIAMGKGTTKGVDVDIVDAINENNLDEAVLFAKQLAKQKESIIVITGAIDLVADSNACYVIRNGRAEMEKITGTGCQLSGLLTAYVVANPKEKVLACVAAVCAMGLAGEMAYAALLPSEGNASYRNRIIDAIDNMTGEVLESGAKYELR